MMMRKRLLLFVMTLLPIAAMADKSGKCGESLTWTFKKATKTLSIQGSGAMTDYSYYNYVPWHSYSYYIEKIIVGQNVTTIGSYAFLGLYKVTNVSICGTVTSIGKGAFEGCEGLTSVTIPNSVTSIGKGAFYYCSGLTSIKVESGNTKYDSRNNCNAIIETSSNILVVGCKNTNIPTSVTRIGDDAFRGCSGLISITIPNSVTSIGKHAFPSTTKIFRSDESAMAAPSFTNTQTVKANQIPNLVVVPNSIAFTDAEGANAIVGGKNSTITLKVQNTGKGTAYNCLAKISATGSNLGIETHHVTLGSIAAGETKTIILPITAGMNTQDGQAEFTIQVDEPNGFGTDPHYLTVQTKAFEAPMVQITDYSLTGNAGTTLKKKQPFDLQLMLQNTKYGQAEDISVSIDIPQNVLILDGSRQQNYANMNGGETKSLVYSLIVNNNYQGTTIPIKVHVKEKYGKYAEDRTINLQLDQALASTKIDVKASQTQPRSDIHIATIGSDVDKELPQATNQQQNTFVVIIANEHYQTVDGVPFANHDGAMFEAYCRQTLGIPQDNIRSVKDATLNGMMHQIDWLRKVMEAFNGRASAIVYYAGHGIPDEQSHASFLLPCDGYPTNMKSAYSLDNLYQTLGNMPAHSVTVFLDACFSGSKRGEGMLASARGVALKAKQSAPKGNMVVFSAAQENETAYPYKEQEHGMFTYYLLKKLKESKGETTLGDLADYITQSVRERSIVKNSKSQTPVVSASAALTASWRDMKLK